LDQSVGLFDGRPGQGKVGHKNVKTPHLWRPPKRNPKPKTENYYFWLGPRSLSESVEGLNTSLAAAAGELWPKERATIVARAGCKRFA